MHAEEGIVAVSEAEDQSELPTGREHHTLFPMGPQQCSPSLRCRRPCHQQAAIAKPSLVR